MTPVTVTLHAPGSESFQAEISVHEYPSITCHVGQAREIWKAGTGTVRFPDGSERKFKEASVAFGFEGIDLDESARYTIAIEFIDEAEDPHA